MEFPEALVPVIVGLVDRLIPADDYPSASENGVVNFLRKQWDSALVSEHAVLVGGLEHLAEEHFQAMDDAGKDEFLTRAERGELGAELRRFFRRMVELSAEGYYADPGNGGNAEKISWRMMGFAE